MAAAFGLPDSGSGPRTSHGATPPGLDELGWGAESQSKMWPATWSLLGGVPVIFPKPVASGWEVTHCLLRLPRVGVWEGSNHDDL